MAKKTSPRMTRRATLGGAAAAVTTLALIDRPAEAYSQSRADLTGSWLVTNGAPGAVPNTTLVTFVPGGAFVRAGTTHLMETPGHGAWQHITDRDFAITYYTLRFDGSGAFIGHRKTFLLATVEPDGMRFQARTRTLTIDADGTEILGPEGSNRGVRMVAEPFPTA